MHQSPGNASDPKTPPSGASAKLPPLAFPHATIALVQDFYPEIIHQVTVLNAPSMFSKIFALISGMLLAVAAWASCCKCSTGCCARSGRTCWRRDLQERGGSGRRSGGRGLI